MRSLLLVYATRQGDVAPTLYATLRTKDISSNYRYLIPILISPFFCKSLISKGASLHEQNLD